MSTTLLIKDPNLLEINNKINNSVRINKQEAKVLYESEDLIGLGYLAQQARQKFIERANKLHEKDYVYYIINHHLNLTNICEGNCKFCAFRKKHNQSGAYFLTLENAKEYIKNNIHKETSEIHIVSALNPNLNLDYYKKLFIYIKKLLPDIHIQGLTAVEIEYLANHEKTSVKEVLNVLKDAGLGSLPGGGAEIFSERLRSLYFPQKISAQRWLEIMKTAHLSGLKTNATMLSGIGETIDEIIDHIVAIRQLQDDTQGFMSFIPLFCHYKNTEMPHLEETSAVLKLKHYAVSRILLDNIAHLKAFRIQTGIDLAQISLEFGVDDLDGTVIEEKISKNAGASSESFLSKEKLMNLIINSGKIPVERDTVYNIKKVGSGWKF